MKNTINFGIDLGTTNSAVAKYEDGEVILFKNPLNLKQTLPSVVAFRKNRTVVGDKAREIMQKDPANVVGGFKRKMGTSDTWFIKNAAAELTAEDLSACVLKELKNFIHTGETPASVVITIPASFDTMQSNATKKAGYAAGFREVVLLQEPIAASLAYANKGNQDLADIKWLVYDLGGGTFDVALVSIEEDEMRVLDHEGNNYLGGTDFDKAIIEQEIIPALAAAGTFADLEKEMKSASGRYNKLYNLLQIKAEEAKIQLTNSPVAEIEFETEDDTGEEVEIFLELTRDRFNEMIRPYLDSTFDLVQKIINRNHLQPADLAFVLMIGGSTYIPAVREQTAQRFGTEVNRSIDPTAAVAVGAAYFAGMKPAFVTPLNETDTSAADLTVKTAYAKATQDERTPFLARVIGDTEGKTYRITRSDGGYDSGSKPLTAQITEYLPLVAGVYNSFAMKVFDSFGNALSVGLPAIGIMHGKFSVDGQPLPHDICLEVDASEEDTTVLEPVFKRNEILPLKKTLVKEISRHIRAGSDDALTINVVEGPVFSLPTANKTIGFVKIAGKDLNRDLIKGSDVELTFEMSESRDLKVEVYLSVNDREYINVFSPSKTHIDTEILAGDLRTMSENLRRVLVKSEREENYSDAAEIQKIIAETQALSARLDSLQADDVTDEKYQIDEAKRGLARRIYAFFNSSVLQKTVTAYYEMRNAARMQMMFNDLATDADKKQLETLTADEKETIQSDNLSLIKMKTKQIEGLLIRINSRKPTTNEDIVGHFSYLRNEKYVDRTTANALIVKGENALSQGQYSVLLDVVNQLYRQLEDEKYNSGDNFKSSATGLK